jgi:hypothetical protein
MIPQLPLGVFGNEVPGRAWVAGLPEVDTREFDLLSCQLMTPSPDVLFIAARA